MVIGKKERGKRRSDQSQWEEKSDRLAVAVGMGFSPERARYNSPGQTTKECRPGLEGQKNRPRESIFQGINIFSDGIEFMIKIVGPKERSIDRKQQYPMSAVREMTIKQRIFIHMESVNLKLQDS